MRGRTLLGLTTALLSSAALTPVTAFAAGPTCAQLATNPAYGLAGNVNITQTASDNQGLVSPSAAIVPATSTNAAICLVHLQFSSQAGPAHGYAAGESQTIGINIGLPLNSTDGGTPHNPSGYSWTAVNGAWNGKVVNLGGGGFQGQLGFVTPMGGTLPANTGYVESVTDTGHNQAQNGNDGNWAVLQATHQLDVGKITDFASESIHQQDLWTQVVAKSYYGQTAARNYFYGCSTGGRQGFTNAENWGEFFDGILMGSPIVDRQRQDLAKAWETTVNRDLVVGAGHPAITINQYNAAVSHAIAACDVEGADVVADGVVDDPRQCKYTAESDPTILSAPAGTCVGANCLDLVQAQVMDDEMWSDGALHGGARNHFGRRIYYGNFATTPNPNSGIGPASATDSTSPESVYDWDHRDLTARNGANIYSTRALATANPLGLPNPIAIEDELQLDQTPVPPSATTNQTTTPVGSYFVADNYQGIIDHVHNGPKHGKIVLISGVNDNVPMNVAISYYRATATSFGNGRTDYAGLASWFRYYHVPGVGVCGGNAVGASPSLAIAADGNTQMFDDLVNWAENGVVPQSAGDYTKSGILAIGPGSFGSRPICPYPTTAIYNGSGPTNVASSFHCGGNLDTRESLCMLPITLFGRATSNQLNYKELGIDPGLCEGDHDHDADADDNRKADNDDHDHNHGDDH
jgi:hypothetical protein